MAKQASKPKPRTSGRGRSGAAKAAPKDSKASGRAAKPTRKSAAPASAAPAKRVAGPKAAAKPKAKLEAAGKAITSGHAKSATKASSDGASASKKKTAAAKPARPVRPAPAKAAQKKGRTAKRVTFDRKTLMGIKKSLEDQRADLVGQLEELEESAFSPGQAEAASEAGSDDDYADAGTVTFEREKDLSIANNISDLLDKIDKALEKIEEGSYGLCENCGQPISAERLKALPHVVLCINCKKAEERR